MVKNILWVIVGINVLALIIFIIVFLNYSGAKPYTQQVSQLERDWMILLVLVSFLVILLAAVPLRYGHSNGWIIFGGFFAILPWLIAAWFGISFSNSAPDSKSMAETYYKDKTQRRIANSIEKNDTTLLKELVKGQNLNIQGTRVWDWEGINYLQFAIRAASGKMNSPINTKVLRAVIRILIENGSSATPALAEACKYLSPEEITLLLNAGADPNCAGFPDLNPLLCQVIGDQRNDIAILLLQKGANVNALNEVKYTPIMYAVHQAGSSEYWYKTWYLVYYMLEESQADYKYTSPDGTNLAIIINGLRTEVKEKKIVMPPDFDLVIKWLEKKKVLSATF